MIAKSPNSIFKTKKDGEGQKDLGMSASPSGQATISNSRICRCRVRTQPKIHPDEAGPAHTVTGGLPTRKSRGLGLGHVDLATYLQVRKTRKESMQVMSLIKVTRDSDSDPAQASGPGPACQLDVPGQWAPADPTVSCRRRALSRLRPGSAPGGAAG